MRPTRVAFLLSVVFPVVVAAQARQAGATHSDAKTWVALYDKSARVRDAFAAPDGKVWFVGQEGNFVAHLDPSTGAFKRFTIDDGTNPHNLVVDKQGSVWFTGNRNGRIVRLDPATGKLTNYPMPDPSIRDPQTMIFDANGDAWFTAQNAGIVGKLTRAGGTIRIWRMPSGSRPYGIKLDSKGRPFFDLFGTNKIGTIDPRTGAVREYTLPNDRARPRRIELTDDRPNRLVAFDPKGRRWVESIPIPSDGPNTIRHMQWDQATRQIWFADDAGRVGRIKVAPVAVVP